MRLYAHLSFVLVFLNLILQVVVTVPGLTALHQLWLLYVIIPLISIPIVFTAGNADQMAMMPNKAILDTSNVLRFVCYSCVRAIVIVSMCIAIYVVNLAGAVDEPVENLFAEANFDKNHLSNRSDEIVYSQNIMLFFLVVYSAVQSTSFVHRNHSILKARPYQNYYWMIGCAIAILAQGLFWLASSKPSKSATSYWVIVACIWTIVVLSVDVVIKWDDNQRFSKQQRKAKLIFETKLGMHSPVIGGQYIDEI